MKQIETIKTGKNYSAVSVGKMDEIIEHVLPIAEMDYYDLQPTPPVLLHFDLMADEVTSNHI